MQDSGERFPQGVRCFGIGGPDEPGIDVGGRADLRMAQASGHCGDGHMGSDQQRSVGMPLRYNKDKRKNPVFSRVSAFVVAYSIPFPTLIVNEKSVE